ncbi:hypothetical protein [Glycomyces arizonensis]|uniref:hypothetical protein n=1 Tax=Glycomyces arizonensis TaxID=256035 RepID=UPI000429C0D7|nr:hypothetical protein [Glycomyces arizonensis]
MGVGRTAPHRVRAAYLRALTALPIPDRSARMPDPVLLTVLGTAAVAGRDLAFCTFTASPRLWVGFDSAEPRPFGFLTGLSSGDPDLWISDYEHETWISESDHGMRIKTAAVRVWEDGIRACGG